MITRINNLILILLTINFFSNLLSKQTKLINSDILLVSLTFFLSMSYIVLIKYPVVQNVKFNNKLVLILLPMIVILILNFTQISKNLKSNDTYSPVKLKNSKTSVSIILFDGFALNQALDKNGQIDKTNFPGLHKLSQLSTFYINGTSNAGDTDYSVPSLMSGRYPELYSETNSNKNLISKEDNFFSIFANTHDISAKEAVTNYCRSFKCSDIAMKQETLNDNRNLLIEDSLTVFLWSFLPKNLSEKYLPNIGGSWGNFRNTEIRDQENNLRNRRSDFEDFLNREYKSNKPLFTYLHVMLPHEPYEFLPEGKKLYNNTQYINEVNSVYKTQARQRYRMQILYTDKMLGDLADKIKKDLNDQMVIFLSDHGESLFTKENSRGRSNDNLLSINDIGSVMSVPIFIHYPNQNQPKIDQAPIQLIDILPIVTGYLGINGNNEINVDGLRLDEIKPNRRLWWFLNGETSFFSNDLDHTYVAKKNSELFDLKNNKKFYMYAYGPYKDLIGAPIDNFRIQKSSGDEGIFVNEKEIKNLDLNNNGFLAQFLIYSDNISKILKKDLEIVKYYAVTSEGKIGSITQAIPVNSLRENGQALDLRVDAILNPSIFTEKTNQIKIFEIMDSNTLKSID